MQFVQKIFPVAHFVTSMVFVICAAVMLVLALLQIWQGVQPGTE